MTANRQNPLQKTLKIIGAVFLLIGVVDLGICVFAYQTNLNFLETAISAPGTVIEMNRSSTGSSSSYYPVVQFTTNQGEIIEFQSNVSSNPPSYQTGDEVAVLYPEDTPEKARIDSFSDLWLFVIIFAGVGGSFTIAGMGMLFYAFYSQKIRTQRQEKLKAEGKVLITQYTETEQNTNLRVNKRSPYRILSQWHNPVEDKIYIFKSDNIWFNPEEFARDRTLKVYVNPDNYDEYYMDIDFLPELQKQ